MWCGLVEAARGVVCLICSDMLSKLVVVVVVVVVVAVGRLFWYLVFIRLNLSNANSFTKLLHMKILFSKEEIDLTKAFGTKGAGPV